jgi:hypothetical protein
MPLLFLAWEKFSVKQRNEESQKKGMRDLSLPLLETYPSPLAASDGSK